MTFFRFLAIVAFLITALPTHAGVILRVDDVRFELDRASHLHQQAMPDWAYYLPLPIIKREGRYWREWLAKLPHWPLPAAPAPRPEPEQVPVAVWEPPVLGLMAVGLAGLVGARRRLRQSDGDSATG